jgi:hypothetical protein
VCVRDQVCLLPNLRDQSRHHLRMTVRRKRDPNSLDRKPALDLFPCVGDTLGPLKNAGVGNEPHEGQKRWPGQPYSQRIVQPPVEPVPRPRVPGKIGDVGVEEMFASTRISGSLLPPPPSRRRGSGRGTCRARQPGAKTPTRPGGLGLRGQRLAERFIDELLEPDVAFPPESLEHRRDVRVKREGRAHASDHVNSDVLTQASRHVAPNLHLPPRPVVAIGRAPDAASVADALLVQDPQHVGRARKDVVGLARDDAEVHRR